MRNIKVQVICPKKHPVLNKVIPMGFETELVPSPKEIMYQSEWMREPMKMVTNGYAGYTFVGKDGNTYDEKFLFDWFGFKPLTEIFKKI